VARAETWPETAAFWGYRFLADAAPVIPAPLGHALARAAGSLAYRRLHGRRAVVAANQARVLGLAPDDPRVRDATRDAFRLYARYWFDTFHLASLTPAAFAACVSGRHAPLEAALARGRGCILVSAHFGNWDAGARYVASQGFRIAAVAEQLRPARLAALFRRHRERLGVRVLPLIDPRALRDEIAALLADDWVVALLGDRALSRRGIEVEMFGWRRAIPGGPALLSVATGAPIVVVAFDTIAAGWRFRMSAPMEPERTGDTRADVAAAARRVAAALERVIAPRPADWHLFEPGWPA
jgi:KDO2-lipid IV(A) lauroyltransferase